MFNEKVHAYLAAKYYYYLKERYADQGKEVFIHCTRFYAEQRGRRMAKRALRDNKVLTYRTYQEYGEWRPSKELIDKGESNVDRKLAYSPDLINEIIRCPWHAQFKEMGMSEAGKVYCSYLDNSICRGFNPEISYLVTQTLHEKDSCIHIIKDVNYEEGESHPRKEEFVRDFAYHCAHLFYSFSKNIKIILKDEQIPILILKDLEKDYGEDLVKELEGFKDTDFECID